MKEFKNKVAVITGGASGIGLAIAQEAAARGMKLVIADIEDSALDAARDEFSARGVEVLAVKTDVTDVQQMQMLAEQTIDKFGAIHLLVNNAGVGGVAGPIWETELSDWTWVLNVNMNGVINGSYVFAKIMVEQNEGHIVNTASVAGLMSASGMGGYTVSKHAVVALSEVLYGDFQTAGSKVDVSVLCPSYIATNIGTSDRNRPDAAPLDELTPEEEEKQAQRKAYSKKFFDEIGMPPVEVASKVFSALENRQFYILTHPVGTKEKVTDRMSAILNDSHPPKLGSDGFPTPE